MSSICDCLGCDILLVYFEKVRLKYIFTRQPLLFRYRYKKIHEAPRRPLKLLFFICENHESRAVAPVRPTDLVFRIGLGL